MTVIDNTIQEIIDAFKNVMGEEQVALMAPDYHSHAFRSVNGLYSDYIIEPKSDFHLNMSKEKKVFVTSELPKKISGLLRKEERDRLITIHHFLKSENIEYIVPMVCVDMITGYIVSFVKDNNRIYSNSDIRALQNFSTVYGSKFYALGGDRVAVRDVL